MAGQIMTEVPAKEIAQAAGGDFTAAADPWALFAAWMGDAEKSEPDVPNAMSLATVDADGMPNVRVMLLKGVDDGGFVFYTNYESAKGRELLASGQAAMGFYWKSLHRQVRVRGKLAPVTAEEADAYFASRPEVSRLGAWASQQSRPLESRKSLEDAVAAYGAKFGGDIPRPAYWSGFRLTPVEIEFWQEGPFRLHDRIVFRRASAADAWEKTRLNP
jgi:pyridoxamine 5'-phosphate oxidase